MQAARVKQCGSTKDHRFDLNAVAMAHGWSRWCNTGVPLFLSVAYGADWENCL